MVVCHGAARAEDVAAGIALAAHLRRRRATDQVRALLDGAEAGDREDRTDRTTDTEVPTS